MTTGPVHWKLLIRSRALDNQMYAAGVSVARDETASYVSWANSTLVSPWGEVMVNAGDNAGDKEMITCTNIDIDHVADVRQKVPVLQQRRTDLYELKNISS